MSHSRPGGRAGRAVETVLCVGAVTSIAAMLHAGEPGRPPWWPGFLLALAWVLLPYAIVWRGSRRRAAQPAPRILLLVASVAMTAFSLIVLYGAFVAHPDPQSGLVLIFIPLYQLLGLAPFFICIRYLARRPG